MSVEQPVEVCLVGFGEVVGPAQEGEAGSEQVWFERWGPPVGVAALYLASYQGEALGEPEDDVEPVEHMASVGQILCDGCLVGAGPTASAATSGLTAAVPMFIPPSMGQRCENPARPGGQPQRAPTPHSPAGCDNRIGGPHPGWGDDSH